VMHQSGVHSGPRGHGPYRCPVNAVARKQF
jgi:hypothetical protein